MTWFNIIQIIISYFAIGLLGVWVMLRIPGFCDKENEEDVGILIGTVFFWPIVYIVCLIAGISFGIKYFIVNVLAPDDIGNDSKE